MEYKKLIIDCSTPNPEPEKQVLLEKYSMLEILVAEEKERVETERAKAKQALDLFELDENKRIDAKQAVDTAAVEEHDSIEKEYLHTKNVLYQRMEVVLEAEIKWANREQIVDMTPEEISAMQARHAAADARAAEPVPPTPEEKIAALEARLEALEAEKR